MTVAEFIRKSKNVHGLKYDYSKVEYVNSCTNVCIVCPKHGEFLQTPNHHLIGCGCPKCSHQSYKDNTASFIQKARNKHGMKYDYSKVEYVNSHEKVCITCPKHGEFWQTPTNHLSGRGCNCCKKESLSSLKSSTKSAFLKKAILVHGMKYDYSNVDYINNHTKVRIICPKHGEFLQTPNSHLSGKGCPKCQESHLEKDVRMLLEEKHIEYESSKHFSWLGQQHLDYYLPSYNLAIECQGEQHFIPSNKFNKKHSLDDIIKYDKAKFESCCNNNVKLVYFTYPKIMSLVQVKPLFYTDDNLIVGIDELNETINGLAISS